MTTQNLTSILEDSPEASELANYPGPVDCPTCQDARWLRRCVWSFDGPEEDIYPCGECNADGMRQPYDGAE